MAVATKENYPTWTKDTMEQITSYTEWRHHLRRTRQPQGMGTEMLKSSINVWCQQIGLTKMQNPKNWLSFPRFGYATL